MPGKLILRQKNLKSLKFDKKFKVCLTEEKTRCFPGIWRHGMESLRGPWVQSPSPRILAGSFIPAGWSELVRKEELGEASLRSSAEMFSGETPFLILGTAWGHSSLMLGCCLSCTVAMSLPGWYPADGSPDPATGSQFPIWTSGLPLRFGRCCSLLWFHCACQDGLGHLSSNGAVLQQRMMDHFSSAAGELNRQESLRMTSQAPLGFKLNPSLQESSYCLKLWTHTMASTSSKTQKELGSRACAAAKDNWANGESTGMIFHNNHREREK